MKCLFLDTNIFIHYKGYEDILWQSLLDTSDSVKVVLALFGYIRVLNYIGKAKICLVSDKRLEGNSEVVFRDSQIRNY